MEHRSMRVYGLALAIGASIALSGCGSKEPAPAAPATPPVATVQTAPDAAQPAPAQPPQPLQASTATWTPEAMEELLAPVALYPDVVLGQVLVASTNPQEVLDAGNWLLQNQSLEGNALDEAAKQVGFTPPVRGLMQSPEVIDMMCIEMGWTAELGQAYVDDQTGVLDAVQRLRAQAEDVGNLESSAQMTVATEVQEGHEVITVSPPSPQVVYVPQYDPVAVYAPPPAAPAAAPATTATVTEDKGHSTGTLVATGLLSFGAGILVANIFDDDDDDWYSNGYYKPRYYGPPMPYYPPYPYRPRYGSGYYPSHGYDRPRNYQHSFNNNTIIVNRSDGNYWNRYDDKSIGDRNSRAARSPITAAKPDRPELNSLNAQAKNGPKRPAPAQTDAWKGQSSYAGGQQTAADAKGKVASATPAAKPVAKAAAPNVTRPEAKPATGQARAAATDRGYSAPSPAKVSKPANKSAALPSAAPERARTSAVSGAKGGGNADRAAAQRGKQSMPAGVPAKAKGGSGKKAR